MKPWLRPAMIIASVLALWTNDAQSDTYDTQRNLYGDCTAPESEPARHQDCAAFLQQTLAIWNMRQANPNICSRYFGDELPSAYVRYWQSRGISPEENRSAEASVIDFLNRRNAALRGKGVRCSAQIERAPGWLVGKIGATLMPRRMGRGTT